MVLQVMHEAVLCSGRELPSMEILTLTGPCFTLLSCFREFSDLPDATSYD